MGLQVLGTPHHSWKGMVLRAALAGRAGEAVGHIVPEREEHWLSPFCSVWEPRLLDGAIHIQDGFFPSQINSSGNSLLRDLDVSLRLTQNTAS